MSEDTSEGEGVSVRGYEGGSRKELERAERNGRCQRRQEEEERKIILLVLNNRFITSQYVCYDDEHTTEEHEKRLKIKATKAVAS